ncbi:MAG: hypothetical protein ABT15_25855 [Pseudonocardia sp. SCN 73-27]|uniref:AfsR/SARP family transcriptional regulator n=1 Tax=Pseudonocardia sp. SCN 73-27 TaxID=1660132 RepID=UPI00086F340B|nr:BTAD domain-containing putative transcriptional regulator [Pseudonocardia sp. SCN 73-27]ODV02304.1 MAG: hypothetical protein ABT15_25855 [Pseudonocardia sp. SCN 73-27]
MLTVAVLGRVEAHRDGVAVPVPRGLTTALLVRLALEAGTRVRTDRLLDELWPDDPAARPNTLQAKASQLRRALGDPGLLVGDADGYTLAVPSESVDAAVAVTRAEEGSALLAAGDVRAAAAACADGLALFGTEVLPGAGDWAAPHRARLEETRLRLAEDGAAARLELGQAGELVGELEGLVAAHPLRERLWTLLVTALYRAGRQSDALAAHRRVTALLAEELGVDPGPELAAVGRKLLAQDESLDPVPRPRGNLPSLTSPLVGRVDDLAGLVADLDAHRLVTVVGPGGVGKTRLAVEAARPSGAWLVRLDGVAHPAGIAAALADVVPGVDATDPAGGLRGADHLLLLDTCEHLADDVAALVATLLDAAPQLRVLATSRRALGIDGERVRALDPLPEADAVALFRARAARPGDDPAQLEDLCRALDCLPLALELAAARTRVLTVPEIAARLDDRFALLTDPAARRRSLDAAIAWSYDLLFPDDQRGLWALAQFPDGAGPAAVAHVLAALDVPAGAALDVVDRLVDRSLVTAGTDRTAQPLPAPRQRADVRRGAGRRGGRARHGRRRAGRLGRRVRRRRRGPGAGAGAGGLRRGRRHRTGHDRRRTRPRPEPRPGERAADRRRPRLDLGAARRHRRRRPAACRPGGRTRPTHRAARSRAAAGGVARGDVRRPARGTVRARRRDTRDRRRRPRRRVRAVPGGRPGGVGGRVAAQQVRSGSRDVGQGRRRAARGVLPRRAGRARGRPHGL